ncbi:MAG: DEAD/DEAH box helicase family protein [Euryarchaeota archaeon]|nr:DEAD/DEAH box helicase family protein [Euryarchaeota archaeon]MBU4340132.1 DEAD/DEAH box helicase family protein [Euryarchaeota archaeon]MBU4454647.1 DEAD/DEAH box helicase family protein [Euryarchaeota archaeon]
MNKKTLSERDICTKYVTPAIVQAGWNLFNQIQEEVTFTKGRVMVKGRLWSRGESKRLDFLLSHKPNIPVAIIEAKDNNHGIGDGMQQALVYAEMMDVPFVYSTNGDAFIEHDRTAKSGQIERELKLDAFPSPEELWRRYCAWKGIDEMNKQIVTQDYYTDSSGKIPRYYQLVAINRTIEAIVRGQNRILLVMATGTGKTFTAFQIIWRLWKSRTKKRILYLADRNILIDQTKTNDFKPFGSAMTKIVNRNADKSFEIYLSLYQAVSGPEEWKNIYKQFSPDFFDLVIVDECHRGSAAEDSAWREILEYFSSATQIGMTATPKETKEVSNIHYFGEPIYTYSLKQGIDDGFLAPYKVVRIDIDKDLTGWRPEKGKLDKYGVEIEDRIYNQIDFDRTLVLEQRTQLVAKKISEFLKATNRFDKTIVFCEDIDHAERMRQALVNENGDCVAQNRKYVMRITGDNEEGKKELDNFILPESLYPVIATTSKLMNTGVDAQTCKLIVIDQRIQSMTVFKQIIGRGTRINEDFDKYYFTIMDFKKATELFADPLFDGDPVVVYKPGPHDPPVPPDEPYDSVKRSKFVVNDVPVKVVAERVQYYGKDGKLITESLKDYTRNKVRKEYESLDSFLTQWSKAGKKNLILQELEGQGLLLDALAEQVGRDYDPFDLICHVVYDKPPLSRRERAEAVRKKNYFSKFGEKARAVLTALLDKYADSGIENIESMDVLRVQPLNQFGTPLEIISMFGGKEKYLAALRGLETQIYMAEA